MNFTQISYSKVINNVEYMKMVLDFSIETNTNHFKILTTIKKMFKRGCKDVINSIDDKVPFYIIKSSTKRVVGFFLEQKELIHDELPEMYFISVIYIKKEERFKGYCKTILTNYSKYDKGIIADEIIDRILLKLCPLYYPRGRKNKDGTITWISTSHFKKYDCLVIQ